MPKPTPLCMHFHLFLQIYSCVLFEEFKFTNFFHWYHKVLKICKSCGFSNFVLVVTSISNLIICHHAKSFFAGPNGIQSNNMTCIFFLSKIVVMCINIFHDLEEQWVMHLILTTKSFCIYEMLELYKGERGKRVFAKASHSRKKERKL
jgi:hypothetical protein